MNNNNNTHHEQGGKIATLLHQLNNSSVYLVIGVILLFLTSIVVVMIAPNYVDKTWTSPSSPFQVQMYKVEDPNIYITSGTPAGGGSSLQYVHHLKKDFTLLAFKESEFSRIISSPELEPYITRYKDKTLKLTSHLLLLRVPEGKSKEKAEGFRKQLEKEWEEANPDWEQKGNPRIVHNILELYDPGVKETFSYDFTLGSLPNWVDEDYKILDEQVQQLYHTDYGVVYVLNPLEYRVSSIKVGNKEIWRYDPEGKSITNKADLDRLNLGFRSREDLIALGEHTYAIEGCWYCHTDQTRTLVQDVVLNGSDSFPAPPSSANEYIYQKITFAGTRRIGPDLSRVGVKRPGRDWHMAHFWSPKTASAGSIMPAFQHFFDNDPRGTGKSMGFPNYRFEAIYQYLMTKGTRITSPTQAWWLGKDPIDTKGIIEGRKKLE